MLQNHVGVAHVAESMFATEEQSPGLNECQDSVLDLKVASSLQRVTKNSQHQNAQELLRIQDWRSLTGALRIEVRLSMNSRAATSTKKW